ncbi:MAG: UTP--glucose-1-phosphate uridylyltransferase [Candidatus Dormibacteria bacterium]
MTQPIQQCVIPAAGLGTRFLPATKALPKELLPVGNRPAIQWGVEEAVAAGASEMVIVLSEGKELIRDHFAPSPELEELLSKRGKVSQLETVQAVASLANFTYTYQEEPLGLGHAVLCARDCIRTAPFYCLLPDDVSYGTTPVLSQLGEAFQRFGTTILALMRVTEDQISRYGSVAIAETVGRYHRITHVVEKPAPKDAPSLLAIMGRYVLLPDIFDHLAHQEPGAGGEIQLTDGIGKMLGTGDIWGVEFEGELLDVGTLEGWYTTLFRLAPEYAPHAFEMAQSVQ